MVVLGADLSWTRSGFVWCSDKFELVGKAQGWPQGHRRLLRAFDWMGHNIGKPDLVVIEDNAYGAPSRTVVVKLSQLNTMLKVTCEMNKTPWLEIAPGKMKRFITGKGTAEKGTVAQELQRRWGIAFAGEEKKGFDLTDAAGLAVWGVCNVQVATNR